MHMRKILLGFAMLFIALMANAQTQTVSGKITDATGAAIPSATVLEKGTKNGTISGEDGSYILKVKSSKAILVFSAVGFETFEAPATNAKAIVLKTDTRNLGEIVVTGVGTAVSKKRLGISVESVTADKLPAAPTSSIDQALIGKIAGAQISTIDGTPGASVNILLRGINTLQGSTMPMILLDGVEVKATNLNSLDLTTIDRVEVVEGAASASLYGAQGANGVIQLFTKKGKNGQINIDVSSSISRNTYLNVGNVHKANFHSFQTDANNNVVGNSGNPIYFDTTAGLYSENVIWPSTDPTNNNNKLYNKNLKHYDHYAEFFVPANTYNNSITISGAKDKFDFLISASNNYQESNFKDNGYNSRSNLTANIGAELVKNLRFRSITELVYTRNTILSDQGFLYALNNTQPFANYGFKFTDGTPSAYYGSATGVNGYNPNYPIYYTHYADNRVDIVQNLDLSYKFRHFVDLDAKYGINYQNDYNQSLYPNQTENQNVSDADPSWGGTDYYFGADVTGSVYNNYYNRLFQNFLATANIHLDLQGDFHSKLPITLNTQAGFDWRNDKQTYNDFYGIGFPVATPYTAGSANGYYSGGAAITPFVTYGYLANERIEYADLAALTVGFRTDYSSAFGAGHTPFTFPTGNAYFRVSSLGFWKNSSLSEVFTDFKIRAAYGKAGIQPGPFDRYVTLSAHTLGNNNAYYFPPTNSNPNLQVEVSEEKELGGDLAFKLSKSNWFRTITLSGTYWKRSSNNTIWSVDVAPSTGAGTVKTNAFSLGSYGYDFSLNTSVLASKNFTWNFTTNFGHQVSKILSTDGQPVVLTSYAGSTGYVLTAGEKVGQLYGYLVLHSVDEVDKTTGQPYIDKTNQGGYTVASNGIVVNKTTKQPYVTPNLYSFGDPNPKFNVSFMNDFTFNSYLSFGFQFDWVYGSHIYNQTKEWMYRDGISGDYDKAITIDGQTGAWTAFYRGMYAQVSRDGTKSYFYENASFLRLRNVYVAFDIAKAFNVKAFRKLQLVFTGRNILTVTKYTGYDPEISSGANNSPWDRGTDHNTMPNYKSYQVGLNIGL